MPTNDHGMMAGNAARAYDGVEQFGRVIDQRWQDTQGTPVVKGRKKTRAGGFTASAGHTEYLGMEAFGGLEIVSGSVTWSVKISGTTYRYDK